MGEWHGYARESTSRSEQRIRTSSPSRRQDRGTVKFNWESAGNAAGVTADNFPRQVDRTSQRRSADYTVITMLRKTCLRSVPLVRLDGRLEACSYVQTWVDQALARQPFSSAPVTLVGGLAYDGSGSRKYYENAWSRHGHALRVAWGPTRARLKRRSREYEADPNA